MTMPSAFGPTPAWHDAHLEIHGPAVADVEHCFRERWDDPTAPRHLPWHWLHDRVRVRDRTTVRLPPAGPPPAPCGPHTVQLLRTYPTKLIPYPFAPRGERSVARGLAKALSRARRLVYVEDQYLWSSRVAAVFADALRREPSLRMVAVLPAHLDPDQGAQAQAQASSQRRALAELRRAGGDRFEVYAPENHDGRPVYVHAKVCVVDDVWVSVGSANINRRSWTHDSELTAAVLDRTPDHRGPSDTGASPAVASLATCACSSGASTSTATSTTSPISSTWTWPPTR
jgi:phosphatidylserine/phosphatidylglycerophosphate/cardiolipin synthase-like enzyme